MRPIYALALAVLASATFVAETAVAGDVIHLTPTLYREQARATAAIRSASELTTTPSLTPRAPATPRVVAEVAAAAR
ncbi:hypothetical protein OCOJLMKI_4439 [Methylobacterium iners]|uniref:DUF4148 domain-containing protein n=1 Tax=Methylobacterium iners TaxID=418707 RepID=A0ABQ4S2G6_9HYPH|nr:hypothetical protein OCOJLMKI_4439 [Methylobacterium iners]